MKALLSAFLLITSFGASAQKVVLDSYFNNEQKTNAAGELYSWHYKWGETAMSGFSILGSKFVQHGADTVTLYGPPTAASLAGAAVYIIVDPDNAKENSSPALMSDTDIRAITQWVKAGGVLLLMGNDSANAELAHFSRLAQQFGITFSNRSRNMVKGKDFPTGSVIIPAGNPVFPSVKKVYLKELSILDVKPPAKAVVKMGEDVIIAVAKVGKGTVFAVGDPWLYNEYTDGTRIPAEYENAAAADDLAKWTLQQVRKK